VHKLAIHGSPPSPADHKIVGDPSCLSPQARARRSRWPVALVSMPFVSIMRPSIQIGGLAVIARSHGFEAETLHLNLEFAARLGPAIYQPLGDYRTAVGDWLFSAAAFGEEAPDHHGSPAFLQQFGDSLVPGGNEDSRPRAKLAHDFLLDVRRRVVPAFLDDMLSAVPWQRFRLVGFTSTFQQNAASFALARRLKQEFPELVIVFGGANFDGDMGREWVRTMSFIDYAVTGEGDVAFPALLAALADERDPLQIPGVLARRGHEVKGTPPASALERMDELPVPDYDEFFERAERLGLLESAGRRDVQIPFEGARGCWWGAKHHCTFCGLNGQSMAFRAKSPARLLDELAQLVRRYRSFDLYAIDNIAAVSVLREVLPELSGLGTTYRLFYEVKANLSREQVKGLRAGGVRHVQPGIESMSSAVLALMRKGARATTNVNLLRWCRYYGIKVYWNLLWGFPGEAQEFYDEQASLIPWLSHLEPPGAASRIWMERFSPLFTDRVAFPAKSLRPDASLSHVYPARVRLDQVAYFFDFELENCLADSAYTQVTASVAAWREAWAEQALPSLRWWSSPGLLQIEDLRRAESPGTHTFEDPLARLYLACSDKATTADKLRYDLELPYSTTEVLAALEQFCERGLMMRDGDLFLALALPATGGAAYEVPSRRKRSSAAAGGSNVATLDRLPRTGT
jgi:ribosomal peptide maturation radical SAM protein 1